MALNRPTAPANPQSSTRILELNSPLHKGQLVPDSLSSRQRVFIVVNGPSTVFLRKLPDERVKVLLSRRLEDDDGALVVGQAVDDV